MDPTFKLIAELGVIGLLFTMWWFERKDRLATEKKCDRLENVASQSVTTTGELVKLVKESTAALVALKEEVASWREA